MNGNCTSDGKYTYTWNEADQLVAITKKAESTPFATYKYDDLKKQSTVKRFVITMTVIVLTFYMKQTQVEMYYVNMYILQMMFV